MIKVIGIGNILLCDDGIGVRIVERLQTQNSHSDKVKYIVGDTDFWYCLDNIDRSDYLFIIDSTYLGKEPGSITEISLEECDKYLLNSLTEHGDNFVNVLRREEPDIRGTFIGIEVETIDYSIDLSKTLENKLDFLAVEVKKIVDEYYMKVRDGCFYA